MLIAIIGPDGCGKTTIANELVSKLNQEKIKATHSAMHFEILPKLKDLINPFLTKKIDSRHIEGELYVGMKAKPNSSIMGSIYVIWYALDYFLGHFKVWKLTKNKEVIIFARYYYDYYSTWASKYTTFSYKIFERLIPKPNLIFTISRPPKDIFDLKPELSVSEIERQQKLIERYLNSENAYIIDGSVGVDETVSKIYKSIKKCRITHFYKGDLPLIAIPINVSFKQS